MKDPQKYIEDFNSHNSFFKKDCLFVKNLRKKGFTTEQIADILFEINGICKECWNNYSFCKCWDDS